MIEDETKLREIAEQHSVGYDVWPEKDVVGDDLQSVGFQLDLYGTHDHGHTTLTPGCDRCVRTYHDLEAIATWIIPKRPRDPVCQIFPFDAALHESPRRNFRPEVLLTIRIAHGDRDARPIDDSERRCLQEMEDKLKHLGIPQGR